MVKLICAVTIAVAFTTASAFASILVKNRDDIRYDLLLNCGALNTNLSVEPDSNLEFNMEGSECSLTLVKTGDSVDVNDDDVLIIKNRNLFKD
jgi:hypothetical protein